MKVRKYFILYESKFTTYLFSYEGTKVPSKVHSYTAVYTTKVLSYFRTKVRKYFRTFEGSKQGND